MKEKERTDCPVCGKAAFGEGRCCSSGCSLAHRIPLGEKDLPVSWPLSFALISFFLLFNQDLFAGMRALSIFLEKTDLVGKFETTSIVFGALWLASGLVALAAAGVWKWTDRAALIFCVAVGFSPRLFPSLDGSYIYTFALANSLMGMWLSRGLFHLWRRQKNRKAAAG